MLWTAGYSSLRPRLQCWVLFFPDRFVTRPATKQVAGSSFSDPELDQVFQLPAHPAFGDVPRLVKSALSFHGQSPY